MALPFLMPRDEATEEQYRRLEQLLCHLYIVLRDLITGGAGSTSSTGPSNRPQPPPPPPPSSGRGPTHPSTDRHQPTPRSSTTSNQTPRSPSNVSYSRQRSARTPNPTSTSTTATFLSPIVNIATMLAQNHLSASRVPHPTSDTTTTILSPILNIATLLARTSLTRAPHSTAARDPPHSSPPESTKILSTSNDYWRNLGCELRGIADQFKASKSSQVKETTDDDVVSLQFNVRRDGAISLVRQPQT